MPLNITREQFEKVKKQYEEWAKDVPDSTQEEDRIVTFDAADSPEVERRRKARNIRRMYEAARKQFGE